MLTVILVIGFLVILGILLSRQKDNSKSLNKFSSTSIKKTYATTIDPRLVEIDVPNPTVVSPKRFLDFIENTTPEYLWPVYEQLQEQGLLKNLALKKAIYEKARFDIFDRQYYDSCFLDCLVNEGYIINGVNFDYKFSFALNIKNELSINKIRDTGFVGKNVSISAKSNIFQVKLVNLIIGSIPAEYSKLMDEISQFEIHAVIESIPTGDNQCVISVNVSELPKYFKPEKETKEVFEIAGAFTPSRKEYIIENCNEHDTIKFQKEASNKYDKNAIKILHSDRKIGYVAREDQKEINKLLKTGRLAIICHLEIDSNERIDICYKFE